MSNWSSFCFKNREQLQQIQNISGNNRTFIFKPITKEFGKHFKKDVCRIGIKTFTLKNKCGCKYCKNVPNSTRLATIFFYNCFVFFISKPFRSEVVYGNNISSYNSSSESKIYKNRQIRLHYELFNETVLDSI